MPPRYAARHAAALLVLAVLLAGCGEKRAGEWTFAPSSAPEDARAIDLTEADLARLPRAVVDALDAAAGGERRTVELTRREAEAFRAVVPDNPALVRHRGALVGIVNDVIHD